MDASVLFENIEVSMSRSVVSGSAIMQPRPTARFSHLFAGTYDSRFVTMEQYIGWKILWYMIHIFGFLLLLRTPSISRIHQKYTPKAILGPFTIMTPNEGRIYEVP
jgi:hypothetical protein